jgi:hypothetical protein
MSTRYNRVAIYSGIWMDELCGGVVVTGMCKADIVYLEHGQTHTVQMNPILNVF